MNVTRRAAAAIAAVTLVLTGCADAAGGPFVAGPADEPAETSHDHDHEEGHADAHGEGGDHGHGSAGNAQQGIWTNEEIAAAFNAHAGAHADHGPSTGTRTFPTGVRPIRVTIPAIDVVADVTDLSLAGAEPEVPQDFDQVGWYVQTRKPGEIGPAVLAGHVDSRDGPAVFIDLHRLEPGDDIIVDGADGEQRRFAVDEIGQYPKEALPDSVFGFGASQPQLRLITCGGAFDQNTGHYQDNVVVYATLADVAT